MLNHYKTLNLEFGASETEIKKQFRKLAAVHHPDKNGGSKISEEKFKSILFAYETLIDKEKRRLYDLRFKQFYSNEEFEYKNKNENASKPKEPQTKNQTETRKYQLDFRFF